jgi:hypothetical protein
MILGGILYIPIYFFGGGKKRRIEFITEILIVFMPFLVYFCAHSYVFWKGQGNSVGEIRVMAAVFPSAVLLALFLWSGLLRQLKLRKSIKTILGTVLAIYLVFVPFQIHRIPVPLAPPQKLIKEAASWIEDMEYTDRKLYYWDPFWWFFLDINPTDRMRIREGLPNRNDPGKNVLPGSIVLWDAHYGPNEGRTPLEKFLNNPDFVEIKVFRPEYPFTVLGGYNYELHLFERLENTDKMVPQDILDEVRRREDAMFNLKLLLYEDYEIAGHARDTSDLSREEPKSGFHSLRLDENREFVSGLEIPVGEMSPEKDTRINVRVSHRFQNYPDEEPFLLVMSLHRDQTIEYYRTWQISPVELHRWEETVMDLEIPEMALEADILKIYIWNKGKHTVSLDDLIFVLKESKK